jgi:PTS system glucose-specific IIC component
MSPPVTVDARTEEKARIVVDALGGPNNVERAEPCALTRVRVGRVSEPALQQAGVAAVMHLPGNTLHLIVGDRAPESAAAIAHVLQGALTSTRSWAG